MREQVQLPKQDRLVWKLPLGVLFLSFAKWRSRSQTQSTLLPLSWNQQTMLESQRLLAIWFCKLLFKTDAPPCLSLWLPSQCHREPCLMESRETLCGTQNLKGFPQLQNRGRLSGRAHDIYSCEFLSPGVIILTSSNTLVSNLENEHFLLIIMYKIRANTVWWHMEEFRYEYLGIWKYSKKGKECMQLWAQERGIQLKW